MQVDEFERILRSEDIRCKWKGDNALQGLLIITKYLPDSGIEGAEHDIIYSCMVDELVNAGITQEDATKLRRLNWMIEDGGLACYV